VSHSIERETEDDADHGSSSMGDVVVVRQPGNFSETAHILVGGNALNDAVMLLKRFKLIALENLAVHTNSVLWGKSR
jgi:hypothetical protein